MKSRFLRFQALDGCCGSQWLSTSHHGRCHPLFECEAQMSISEEQKLRTESPHKKKKKTSDIGSGISSRVLAAVLSRMFAGLLSGQNDILSESDILSGIWHLIRPHDARLLKSRNPHQPRAEKAGTDPLAIFSPVFWKIEKPQIPELREMLGRPYTFWNLGGPRQNLSTENNGSCSLTTLVTGPTLLQKTMWKSFLFLYHGEKIHKIHLLHVD